MASRETLENFAKLIDFGNYLNIIPFKAKREAPALTSLVTYSTYTCVPCTSKKYFVNFIFAIVVSIFTILAFIKELLFSTASMEVEVIVFLMTIISLLLVGLIPLIWVFCKVETVASLVNTYYKFNYHLGKSLSLVNT